MKDDTVEYPQNILKEEKAIVNQIFKDDTVIYNEYDPIVLSDSTAIQIKIFTNKYRVGDIELIENDSADELRFNRWDLAAIRLIDQLDGNYNRLFLTALKREIQKRLDDMNG
jgi:hypothetical protein